MVNSTSLVYLNGMVASYPGGLRNFKMSRVHVANICPRWVRPRKWRVTSTLKFSSTCRRLTPVLVGSASYKCQEPTNVHETAHCYSVGPSSLSKVYCRSLWKGYGNFCNSGSERSIIWKQKGTALWSAAEWWKNCSNAIFIAKVINEFLWSFSTWTDFR